MPICFRHHKLLIMFHHLVKCASSPLWSHFRRREVDMSISEIMPAVELLSRTEKFQLARLLIDRLAQEDAPEFISGQVFPIYTPEYASEAAAQLAQVLRDGRT